MFIEDLLNNSAAHGKPITRALFDEVVATNSKRRFAVSEDGRRARASQGHTVQIELGYKPMQPPEFLYHGTTSSRISEIRTRGLLKMDRHHVHLSRDVSGARAVGGRRGRPVVLRVEAGRMLADGHVCFLTPNGVWLTEHVPSEYIDFGACQ